MNSKSKELLIKEIEELSKSNGMSVNDIIKLLLEIAQKELKNISK